MTTFNTGNPIGSKDPRDLYDNAENLDTFVNSKTKLMSPDRLGVPRKTYYGIEQDAQAVLDSAEAIRDNLGFFPPIDYASGLSVETTNFTVNHEGVVYAAKPSAVPFTTGAWDETKWYPIQNLLHQRNLLVFATYAEASAAAATLPDGQLVDAVVNEATIRYVVAAGALVQIPEREGDGPLNVRKFITSQIDGTTSNQSGIVAAVAAAFASGADLYWPRGTYVSDANIPDFWNVNHIGPGVIKRGATTWFITPRVSTHTNEMFCSPTAGLSSNDGLTADFPCSVATAFSSRLRLLGDKAAKGQWRIRWLGAGEANGVTLTGLPYFGQALQIWGEDAPDYGELPSKWDGTSASASYAIRINHGNTALAFDFRNIEFINWQKAVGNSGAISNDDRMRAEVWNCKFTNTDIGIWVLQSYIRVRKSTFTNCRTWGVNASYLSYGNIGLTGDDNGNKFIRCGVSVSVARNSVAYVENNDFDEIIDRAVEVNKQSRVRERGNRYNSWATSVGSLPAVLYATEGGLFNNDNNQGLPSVFNLPLSNERPAYRSSVNSTHWHLQRYGALCLHQRKIIDATYTDSERTLVPAADPLVIPSYALYSPSFKLVFEITFSLSAGKTVGFDIAGAGSSTAARIAYVTLPAAASTTIHKVIISVTKIAGSNMTVDVECPLLNYYVYGVSTEASLSQSSVREAADTMKTFRLYVTPGAEAGSVIVRRLESWIQI